MRLQCKDIPDKPIVQFVSDLNGRWGCWFAWADHSTGQTVVPDNSVRRAMPNGDQLDDGLVLAKMAKLIKRGLLSGCPCGCRGDYELTEKGKAYLATDAFIAQPDGAQ